MIVLFQDVWGLHLDAWLLAKRWQGASIRLSLVNEDVDGFWP
jgi:hypothetical protein